MRLSSLRTRCTRLLDELGVVGAIDVDRLGQQLSQRRDRPMQFLAHPQLGELSGIWLDVDGTDVVFYDDALSGVHRAHVIAHELAHIAFGHGHDEVIAPDVIAALFPDLDPSTVRRMLARGSYSDVEEREAEVFASMLLQLPAGPVVAGLTGLPEPVREQAEGLTATFGSRRRRSR